MAEHGVATCDPTIARLRAAINSHDPDQVAASFTVDYQTRLPLHPSRSFTGNDHVRANWKMMFGRVPNIRASVLRAVADAGSGLTWSEWEIRFYIEELTDR